MINSKEEIQKRETGGRKTQVPPNFGHSYPFRSQPFMPEVDMLL